MRQQFTEGVALGCKFSYRNWLNSAVSESLHMIDEPLLAHLLQARKGP